MLPKPPRLIEDEPDVLEPTAERYDELLLPVERYPDPPHNHELDRDEEDEDEYDEPAGGACGTHAPLMNTHGR